MHFVEIIFKNLRRRPVRTLLTVLGLAVAVMAMTSLWSIAWGYAASANDFYAKRGVDIVVVRAGVANRLTSSLQVELTQRIKEVPGVANVDVSLTDMVSLGEADLIGIPLRGLRSDGFAAQQLALGAGEPLAAGDRKMVLIGRGIADALGKKAGNTIRIEDQDFHIKGVVEPTNPFDSNSVVAPLEDVQELMGRQGVVSEVQVQVAQSVSSEDALQGVCRDIENLRDGAGQPLGLKAQPTRQFVNGATESQLGTSLAWAVTVIVFALSLVGMLNTMLMSVSERTRELGVLRAIGWRRQRLVRMILGESVLLGAAGAVVGAAAAALLVRGLAEWSRTSLFVPSNIDITAMCVGFLGAIGAGFVGSVYPALRAASVPPVESLRHE